MVTGQRSLEVLDEAACIELLKSQSVGRMGFVDDKGPMVLPVNIRFVERNGPHWVVVRTNKDTDILKAATTRVAIEIDHIDVAQKDAWSVVARGELQRLSDDEAQDLFDHFDPGPWLSERDEWLIVRCDLLTGRRVHDSDDWPFADTAYL
jgi:nitroimidazol reductase NimA-like FMN-containing flavoprotein (pyridoxamine 5'-phosphate oxidase superfamily)